jgi:hypothetical protein
VKKEWDPILKHFSFGKICKLIVATDFVTEVSMQGAQLVINFDFPIPGINYVSR